MENLPEYSDGVSNKRIRTTNFTYEEMEVLFGLAIKYKHIVEDKTTSVDEKLGAWNNITTEFNALSRHWCKRSTDSLIKFYDSKKEEILKQVAEEKKEIFITAGGKKKNIKSDSNQDVFDVETVFGLENPFDPDNITYCGHDNLTKFEVEANFDRAQERETAQIRNDEELLQLPIQRSDTSIIEWKKPRSVRTPLSDTLKRPHDVTRRTPSANRKLPLSRKRGRHHTTVRTASSSHLAEKYELLLDKRLLIAEYEKQKLENELVFQKEEHKLKIELLKGHIEFD